jgi:hypothetical protein
MTTSDTHVKYLLDDGEYYLRLDPTCRAAQDMATVILERRSLVSTPERIGSVELQADQTWLACVAAPEEAFPSGFEIIETSANRLDAIVALWQHRRAAFLGRHAL